MEVKKRFFCSIFFILVTLFFFNRLLAYAVDELILWGIVNNVDLKGKIITIDVKSDACPGLKRFTVDDISGMDSSHIQIGKRLVFPIDSSNCKEDKIYKIKVRRGKKDEK